MKKNLKLFATLFAVVFVCSTARAESNQSPTPVDQTAEYVDALVTVTVPGYRNTEISELCFTNEATGAKTYYSTFRSTDTRPYSDEYPGHRPLSLEEGYYTIEYRVNRSIRTTTKKNQKIGPRRTLVVFELDWYLLEYR